MNAHHVDLESLRRAVLGADSANVLDVFRLICREGIRIHTVGGAEKTDVVDALREIGLDANLDEDSIQLALSEAVDRPFDPAVTKAAANGKSSSHLDAKRAPSQQRAELISRRASDIEPEPIRWLWPERIAIGKLTMLAGEPGLGKSQLTCWMSAAVSTGGRWPGNEGSAGIGSVIILSAEDDAADTVRPRLDAAGADVEQGLHRLGGSVGGRQS